MTTLLAFSGSARKESLNKKLLARAVAHLQSTGVTVETVDLRELAMPIYDGDLEEAQGRPKGAEHLRERILATDGVLMVSPEYNGSIPPLLKNAIDWVSRPPGPLAFKGKVAGIMGVSAGAYGTITMQSHLRLTLQKLGMHLTMGSMAMTFGEKAFAPDGSFTDPKSQGFLEHYLKDLVDEVKLFESKKAT
ncbi:MAG: NAD(P)H-dependent oxidoreductase [Polyangiaceae bacterium]